MIETIHCINLDSQQPVDHYANPELQLRIRREREERALNIVRQSKQYGFAVRFWEGTLAIDHEGRVSNTVPAHTNISRAFKNIVTYAKERDWPMVTIAEDDMQLTSFKSWVYYWVNIPKDFDIYWGGIYAGQIGEPYRTARCGVAHRIVNGISGMTLITVHKQAYDFFLQADENDHIDRWLGNFAFEKKFYTCFPFVVKQTPGYSENHRRVIPDYKAYEESWQYL